MSAGLRLAAAGHDLLSAGRTDLAWRAVELALEADPGVANAHTLMAHLLELRGDFEAAMGHWRQACVLLPESAGHRFNLALALLRAGELEAGFAAAEARLEQADWSSLAALGSFAGLRHRVPAPGADLNGRRVLVFSEQGLGDNLWAARWLRGLGGRVDLACRGVLRPLLAPLVGGEVLTPPEGEGGAKLNMAALAGRYDAFVPMMSLPHVLGGRPDAAWLVPETGRVAHWRARYRAAFPGAGPIVGVVWRANPQNVSAAERFLPPAVLAGLERVVNLQGGAAEGRDFPGAFDALAEGEPALDEYAAMVAATDVLLTADTMAAHLAGAMGHRAVVAVPVVPNFYWGSTVWYPTLRLVRRGGGAGWEAVGAEMVKLSKSLLF